MESDIKMSFQLDGMTYAVHGDMDPEKMARIVSDVEGKIYMIRQQAPYYSHVKAAILAAILLAEELEDLREEYIAFIEEADIGADARFK